MFHRSIRIAAALAITWLVPTAWAAPLHLSYTITVDPGFTETTGVMVFNSYQDGGSGVWWASQLNGNGMQTVIDDPFEKDTDNMPLEGLMLGIAEDFPGDPPGQRHLVFVQSPEASMKLNHIAFGTAFPTVLEENLLADIETVAIIGCPHPCSDPNYDAAINRLFDFVNGPARNVPNMGDFGSPGSIWFTMGTDLSVMAFSDGQIIGSGYSEVSPVPLPASLWMFAAGFGAVARWKRARTTA